VVVGLLELMQYGSIFTWHQSGDTQDGKADYGAEQAGGEAEAYWYEADDWSMKY
jgi:hypothetical protein